MGSGALRVRRHTKSMLKQAHQSVSHARRYWASRGVAYVTLGGLLTGMLYLPIPAIAAVLGAPSAASFVLLLLLIRASAVNRQLLLLETTWAENLLGITIPIPEASTLTGNAEQHSLLRRILGLTPGYPVWRFSFWLVMRLMLGLTALLLAGAVVYVACLLVWTLFRNAPLDLFGSLVSAGLSVVWIIAAFLALPAALVIVLTVSVALLRELALPLLGTPESERRLRLEKQYRQLARRHRLARTLHGAVGGTLSAIVVQAASARNDIDESPESLRQTLSVIEEASREAHKELRRTLHALREASDESLLRFDEKDLEECVALYRASGLRLSLDVTGDFESLPVPVRSEACYLVEEGCANALRHAGEVSASVRVVVSRDKLEVVIANEASKDSYDSYSGSGTGYGLLGIAERIEAVGGTIDIGPSTNGRHQIRAVMPLPNLRE